VKVHVIKNKIFSNIYTMEIEELNAKIDELNKLIIEYFNETQKLKFEYTILNSKYDLLVKEIDKLKSK